jgi:protein ImuA
VDIFRLTHLSSLLLNRTNQEHLAGNIVRNAVATALIDHLHEQDQMRIQADYQAQSGRKFPAALNAHLIPASRLLPRNQTLAEDELAAFLEAGLPSGSLHELRCAHSRDAGALAGFALAMLNRMRNRAEKPVLWISAPFADTTNMSLFPQGLASLGIAPDRLVMVTPLSVKHALWAADEAAKCTDLAAVILHVEGHPGALDMTATRRLNLRASESGTTVLILRQSSEEEASAAISRWYIAPHQSFQLAVHDARQPDEGIGHTAFSVHLERNRQGATGAASVSWDHQIQGFSHVRYENHPHAGSKSHPQSQTALPEHRISLSANRQDQPSDMGQVVALPTRSERTG